MANIATLAVKLIAESSKFNSVLASAESKLGDFVAGMKKSLIGFGASLAAGFSVKSLLGTAESMDEISKSSRKMGVSIATLQGLRHAADLAGVSTEQLGVGMKTLARRVAETTRAGFGSGEGGSGAAGKVFERLSLSADDLRGKKMDELLSTIADRFNALEDPIEKVAIAQELFGKSGVDMISLLEGGSAGLAKMREEALKLGIVFDEEMGAKIEEFNDNLTRMKKNWEGLKMTVVSGLIEFGEGFADIVDETERLQKFKLPTGQVPSGSPEALRRMSFLPASGALQGVVDAADRSAQQSEEMSFGMTPDTKAFGAFQDQMKRVEQILEQVASPAEQFANKVAELDILLMEGALTTEQHQKAVAHYSDTLVGKAKEIDKAIRAIGSPALTRGSVGEAKAFAAFENQAKLTSKAVETAANKQIKVLQDQLSETKKVGGLLEDILDELEAGGESID